MDKKLKKMIIIISIICLILLVAIFILISFLGKEDDDENNIYVDPPSSEEDFEAQEEELNNKISIIQSEEDFFTIEKQLKNYFLYLKVENKEAVYNLLEENYKTEKQITNENVVSIMKQYFTNTQGTFTLKQVYGRESTVKPIYYAYGVLQSEEQKTNYYMAVYWNLQNNAIALKPLTQAEYTQYASDNLKEDNDKEIIAKQYNKIDKVTLSEEEKALKYFRSYIKNALYDINTAYNSLEQNYKGKKFENINEYMQYINTRKQQILTMDIDNIKELQDFSTEEEYNTYLNNLKFESIEQYKFTNVNGNKQCICIDAYENYYIFDITGAMQYTVILDTYTVDLPEFVTKYNTANDETKVLMNLQRVFDAINDGDYKYAYNKLDETYKANNFASQTNFESYVKQNFFEQNKLSLGKAEKQGDVYLYEVVISDKTGENTNSSTKTFVMQLKEGTDFVMSFSVN